jgi:hypothetical protein
MKFQYESAGFAAVSIGIRMIYFIISVGIFIGLIRKQYSEFKFSPLEWSGEVLILLVLLLALCFANNPIYFLVYASGVFFQYVDAFLELVFVTCLLSFWLRSSARMRLKENESIELTKYAMIKIGVLVCYVIFSFILDILVVALNETAPLFSIANYPAGVIILYCVVSALYFLMVTFFFWELYQAWTTSMEPNINYLLAYLAAPSAVVALSQLIGVVMGYVAVFNRPAPMFYFVITVYNLYVYYLVWAFWPDKTEAAISSIGGNEKSGLLAKVEAESNPSISTSSPKIAVSRLHDGDDVL